VAGGLVLTTLTGLALAGGRTHLVQQGTLTSVAVADTTVTTSAADLENGNRPTLTTCPQPCTGETAGEREAVMQFDLSALPADARVLSATLQVWALEPGPAVVTAQQVDYSEPGGDGYREPWPVALMTLSRRTEVLIGRNAFTVTQGVPTRGMVIFALAQQNYPNAIHWVSADDPDPSRRPRLVVSWDDPPALPTPPTAVPTPAPASPWQLRWADEFSGTSLNTARWNARNNTYLSYDRACITSRTQNVQVANGLLNLRVQREKYTCGSQLRPYTSPYLDTIGKASFTYGRFVMRAKSPNGPTNSTGLWPAFWLRPDDGGDGELDVVELPGGAAYYRAATQAIFLNYSPVKQDNRYTFPVGYPGDGFHVYTTEWEPGVMRWYIDGRLAWTRNRSTTPWFDQAFSRPFHLRLNFQVGGWLGDPTAATVFPATFQVDYVRVYQRV